MTNAELFAFVRKNPISIGCGVLALLLGGLTYLRSSELPEAVALFDQKAADGERVAANVRNGGQLAEQLAAINAAIKTIDSRLIHAGELAQNLQYFYKLEAETGTKLMELRQVTNATPAPGKPASPGPFGVAFMVTVRGEYLAVLDFVRRLEDGRHFCRITTVSLGTTGPDRTQPVTATLALELLGTP